MADQHLRTSFVLTCYSMLSQVLIRLLSFALNRVVLLNSSTRILGIVNVRLTLLHQTILFLAREPNRKVHARQNEDKRIFQENTVYSLAILCFCISMWLANDSFVETEDKIAIKFGGAKCDTFFL